MNKHIKVSLTVIVVTTMMICCKPQKAEEQKIATTPKDSVANKAIQPGETGYADVNGLKMYYEVHGEGKPLVLLHGSFMNIPMNWSHIIPMLAKGRKVITPELQGHGRTRDISREISYEGMSDDVSALLKHLKIDSADILGYSMGGGVAYQMAVRHPEQVRRLVVVSGAYKHDGWWPEAEKSFATFTPDMFDGTPIRKQYDSLGNDPAHFADFVRKVMSIDLKPYDWSKDVKKIQQPIFIVIGDADGVRYEHALELFRVKGGGKMGDLGGLSKSRLAIMPGTTHVGMMMQRSSWLVPMVTDFLDSDLKSAPPTF